MFIKKPLRNFLFVLGMVFTLWGSQQAIAQDSRSSQQAAIINDPVIGRPFNISMGSIDEVLPAVAYNPVDREYLVVWQNLRPFADDDIYAQRISEQGELLSFFTVTTDGEDPAVAYNPKNNTYLVVFTRWVSPDYAIYAQRVDYNGPLGSEFAVAFNQDETEHDPAVAYNTHPSHDEFLVVWENIPPPPMIINKVEG